jgi:hypothetical protein
MTRFRLAMDTFEAAGGRRDEEDWCIELIATMPPTFENVIRGILDRR